MKKILLGSAALTLFAIFITIFQISCQKDAVAQTVSECSETATVNLTITIPLGKTVLLSEKVDNYVTLERKLDANCNTFNSCQYNSDGYLIEYKLDFRAIGTASTKTFVFKNIIPGFYCYYSEFIYSIVGSDRKSCSSPKRAPQKEINLVAGQTYNLTIEASEFSCF